MREFLTETLVSGFDRSDFNCGNPILDNYIKTQASQDMKRLLSVCFVKLGPGRKVQGYYTLSTASIQTEKFPDSIKKKMPRSYADMPVTLLGRLAVDQSMKGTGLGRMLLVDAMKRAFHVAVTEMGSMAFVVDPIDEAAVAFYAKFGFELLPDSGKMFLPMRTIAQLFG